MSRDKSLALSKHLSQFTILIALFVLIFFFSITTDGFLSSTNLFNIMRQVAVNGIAAVGMTMVILTGGIDISVGAMMGVASVGCATMMINGIHPVPAVIITLLLGFVVGVFHGFFVQDLGLPPMIATLATMSILRGTTYIISGGLPVYGFPKYFNVIGQGYVGIVPVPVILMAICFIAGWFVLERTTFGRYVYGVGSNKEASRLSGVSVRKIIYAVYGICGMLSALSGVVLLSRTNSGQPKAGEGYEMDIITAVVMGGVSTNGGEGKIANVIIGLLLMGVLLNGMVMMNIPDYYQRVVKGFVLLLAISYDRISQKKANKK